MKITFIGHACLLIEVAGVRVLSDPWWQGPCFGNQWWIYPRPSLDEVNAAPIDYIYISHGHADHFHRGTLRRFPKSTKILVAKELALAPALQDMDFVVTELDCAENYALGDGVSCRILPTHGGDSLLAITDGTEICINANDALHAAPPEVQEHIARQLKKFYQHIDYLFCGFGIASHFPNCYVIPGKDNERTAVERQRYFNQQWARVVELLAPRYGFPFAADVVLLEPELFWANAATRNERPIEAFAEIHPASATTVIDIAPGFAIADGAVLRDCRSAPIRSEEIHGAYADVIEKNAGRRERTNDDAAFLEAALKQNVALCRSYLLEYSGDYRFLLILRDRIWAIEIGKRGRDISVSSVAADGVDRTRYDIILTSYFAYLRRSLVDDYGNEVLFVGSGCLIEYRDRQRISDNLHRELTTLLARRAQPPRSRFGDQPKWLYNLKSLLKRAAGRRPAPDLYDLSSWTRFR